MWWQITGAWAFVDFNITWVNCLSIYPSKLHTERPDSQSNPWPPLWGDRANHFTTVPPTLIYLRQFSSITLLISRLSASAKSVFSYLFFKNCFLYSDAHKLISVIFKGDSYLDRLRQDTDISLISIRMETYESFATGSSTNDGRRGRLAYLSSITATASVRRLSTFYTNTVGGVIYDPSCKNLQYPNTGLLQSEARQRRRFVNHLPQTWELGVVSIVSQ